MKNPYDGPMGIFTDYDFCDSEEKESETRQQLRAYVSSGLCRQDLEKSNVLPEVVDLILEILGEEMIDRKE